MSNEFIVGFMAYIQYVRMMKCVYYASQYPK
jgi:hypothetical protein